MALGMPTLSVTNLIARPHPRSPLHTVRQQCYGSLGSFWLLKNLPQLADGPRLYGRCVREVAQAGAGGVSPTNTLRHRFKISLAKI